ncbi:MAG: hypothetical protein KGP10_00830 [Actinomycetales bacterium]|nr:hypothetical protein [Actinomycetales bacterium]
MVSTPQPQPDGPHRASQPLLRLDCTTCPVAGHACGDCVVSLMIGPPPELTGDQATALAVLAAGGLVPPLRILHPPP